jgi:hypothetical protein
MAKVHLCNRCRLIPQDMKRKLEALRLEKNRASGGKTYWAQSIQAQGVYADERGVLRLRPLPGSNDERSE